MHGVLRPRRWEYLTEVDFVELVDEVVEEHPPVAIPFESVVELLFETFIVIPSLVLIAESPIPLSGTPGIPNPEQFDPVDFSDLLYAVGVIISYS